MSVELSIALFESAINEKFSAYFNDEYHYDLELVEVKRGKKIESLDIEPYSLLFKGTRENRQVRQGTAKLRSKKIGEIEMFLVSRMPDDEGIYFEGSFS